MDEATGYDNIAPQYGMKFRIKRLGRRWRNNYAFNIYNEEWIYIETYLDLSCKCYTSYGFILLADDYPLFVEVPFYQTRYSIGSKIRFINLKNEAMIKGVVSPEKLMQSLKLSKDEKYDKDFIDKWLANDVGLSSDDDSSKE